jgi:hypothetical protein
VCAHHLQRSERKREREREEKEGERERDVEYDEMKFFSCPEFLFLKGMKSALAPVSYLVI